MSRRPGARRMLQQEDHFRGEQVQLALPAECVLTADLQATVHPLGRVLRVGTPVTELDLLGQHVQPDAAELAGGAGEVLVDDVVAQPDRLENLCGGVGGHRGDAHLAHHLDHALAQRLDVIAHGGGGFDAGQLTLADQVLDRLECEVGVDRGGAVSDEHGDVMDFAGVTALHHQRHLGAFLGAHQVVVHRRDGQQ